MITKLRFIEAGAVNRYQKTWKNHFLYNGNICNPSTGLITLATIAKQKVDDTLMYSEAISEIRWDDIADADVVFISINTFNATRGYEIARSIRAFATAPKNTRPLVVLGGMHASLNYTEAVHYADYVMLGDGDESIVEFIEALQTLSVDHMPLPAEGLWPAAGAPVQIPGLAYLGQSEDGSAEVVATENRPQPLNIETIPDRSLVYQYATMAKRYNTLWPQVHASRGCTGTCDYCCVIAHFGRRVRTRSPETVVEDIRQAVAFHKPDLLPRLNQAVWLTDDNFALDRKWAKSVLHAIIESDLTSPITVQARWELGFDDEMLSLMKQANFFEISLGIEFIDDASFVRHHKHCTRERIEKAIANIQAHGIGVRGLFIMGSDEDSLGVGERLGQFIIDNKIHGCLIQSMFFVPGTPVYEQNKDKLLHTIWERYNGSVVHYPKQLSPAELQQEMINASRKAYSFGRMLHSLLHAKGVFKILAIGETVWHAHLRHEWRKDLTMLREYGAYQNRVNIERSFTECTPVDLRADIEKVIPYNQERLVA